MTFDLLWYGQICVPVAVTILDDYCMAFANMQVSELWPMGLLFLFLLKNIDCGYSLEPHRQGGSNVYPQSMF